MAEKKFQKLIDKILEQTNLFEVVAQKRENVREYFEEEMQCQHLPQGFAEFMQVFDGITMDGFSVFAIDGRDTIQMTYEKYASDEAVEKFMADYKMRSTNSKLFFFATDNRGGRYAFKKDISDEKIFYFEKANPDGVFFYPSFEALLEQKLSNHLEMNS